VPDTRRRWSADANRPIGAAAAVRIEHLASVRQLFERDDAIAVRIEQAQHLLPAAGATAAVAAGPAVGGARRSAGASPHVGMRRRSALRRRTSSKCTGCDGSASYVMPARRCACVRACVRACACRTCTSVCVRVCVRGCGVHAHTPAPAHTPAHTHIRTHTHTHTHTHTRTHTRTHTHVRRRQPHRSGPRSGGGGGGGGVGRRPSALAVRRLTLGRPQRCAAHSRPS
jgi:hypothetical protein